MRMQRIRLDESQWALLAGLGAGAALMYFLDPDRGARRRALVRDKVARTERVASDATVVVRERLKNARNRARGRVHELRARLRREQVDDDTLVARVRSELGHHVEHASAIEVSACNGTVTLCGPIMESELADALSAARAVRGVREVENWLAVQTAPLALVFESP